MIALLMVAVLAQPVPPVTTHWYGVYVNGNKIGWATVTLGRTEKGELIYEEIVDVKLVDSGVVADTRFTYRYVFDPKPPYAFRAGASITKADDDTARTDVKRGATGFVATLVSPAGTRTRDVDAVKLTFADMYAPVLWTRGKRKKGERLTTPNFDLDELRPMSDTMVIDAVEDNVYVISVTTEPTGDRSTLRVRNDGVILSGTVGGVFDMRLEPEAVAKSARTGVDLFALGIARVDRQLGDAETIVELVLEATGEGTKEFASGPRQSWDGAKVLKLGRGHGTDAKATDAEIKAALAESVKYPIHDERIVKLARSAVGNATTARDKVARLVHFVSGFVEDDLETGMIEGVSALDVVKLKKGDCTEHTLLFTALARAAGVPARPVTGFIYAGDENQGFGGHAWNEVVIDGRWVPVDSTWGETEVNATHISLGHGDRADARLTEVLGKLTFKVVSVKRK